MACLWISDFPMAPRAGSKIGVRRLCLRRALLVRRCRRGRQYEVSAREQGIAVHYGDGRVAMPNTTEVCEVDGRIVGVFANMIDAFVDVATSSPSPATPQTDWQCR